MFPIDLPQLPAGYIREPGYEARVNIVYNKLELLIGPGKALAWLVSPHPAINEGPIDFLNTIHGTTIINQLISAIDYKP